MSLRLNTKVFLYGEPLIQGIGGKSVSIVIKKHEKLFANKFISEIIARVYKYSAENEQEELLISKEKEPMPRAEHRLQTALAILKNEEFFPNVEILFNLFVFALVHNMPEADAREILETAMPNAENLPLNPFKVMDYMDAHRDYRNNIFPFIKRGDFDNFIQSRFLISRYKAKPEFLYFILLDTLAGINYLAPENLKDVGPSYLVIKNMSLILGNKEEMHTPKHETLEKDWVSKIQQAYAALSLTKEYKLLEEAFERKFGIAYTRLCELGEKVFKETLIVFLQELIEGKPATETCRAQPPMLKKSDIIAVEFRIKSLERIELKAEKQRSLTDIIGYRIICADMQTAIILQELIQYLPISCEEDYDRFKIYFYKPDKKTGYRDAMHCTYYIEIEDEIIPVEIQYVGGRQVNIENQRGANSDYITRYAKLCRPGELTNDLIYLAENSKQLPEHFESNIFREISPDWDVYDLLAGFLKNLDPDKWPKRLGVQLLKPGETSFTDLRLTDKVKPGSILRFTSRHDFTQVSKSELQRRIAREEQKKIAPLMEIVNKIRK